MKKSFTIVELLIVIVTIGILSVVLVPRFSSNKLNEAALRFLSDIRYTQHLAILNDKFDSNDKNWYKKRWQIVFGTSAYTDNKPAYSIFSDSASNSTGQPDIREIAKNPLDSTKLLSGGYSGILYSSDSRATREMNLGYYGIKSYSLSGGCTGARISFDYLGRPIRGNLASMNGAYSAGTQRLITQKCNITLSGDSSIRISIEPETGYAYIVLQ